MEAWLPKASVRAAVLKVAASSTRGFEAEVLKGEEPLGTYRCPANTTLVLVFTLHPAPQVVKEGGAGWRLGLSWESHWPLLSYAALIPPFTAAALLDLRDLKTRKGRASRAEGAAVVLRYMFHASLLALALSSLAVAAAGLYELAVGTTLRLELGALALGSAATGLIALLYALAKWRGWFEGVDELE